MARRANGMPREMPRIVLRVRVLGGGAVVGGGVFDEAVGEFVGKVDGSKENAIVAELDDAAELEPAAFVEAVDVAVDDALMLLGDAVVEEVVAEAVLEASESVLVVNEAGAICNA